MLCAAFALGGARSIDCPASYFPLTAAVACKNAAAVANRTFGGSGTYWYYPAGCYWHTFTGKVYDNFYEGTIEAEAYAQPVCAGAAARARVRTHACSLLARRSAGTRTSGQAHAQTKVSASV